MDLSRRNFAKLATQAGLAFVAGDKLWAAAAEPVLTLDLVRREYARLQAYVRKIKAESGGKRVILIAMETHNSKNSSVLSSEMLEIIAWQEGVGQLAIEQPKEKPFTWLKSHEKEIRGRLKTEGLSAYMDFSRRLMEQSYKDEQVSFNPPREYNPNISYPTDVTSWEQAVVLGMDVTSADPLHDLSVKAKTLKEQVAAFKAREPKMVTEINAIKGDCLSLNGGWHAPALLEGLTKLGNHVVAINLNMNLDIDGKYFAGEITDPESEQYFRDAALKLKTVYNVAIPRNPQLRASECVAIAWRVALENMPEKLKTVPAEDRAAQELFYREITKNTPNFASNLQK